MNFNHSNKHSTLSMFKNVLEMDKFAKKKKVAYDLNSGPKIGYSYTSAQAVCKLTLANIKFN